MASERILSKEEIETALNERHSPEKQKLLSAGQVTIAGLGGLGSNVAYSLARIGVGHLHLIDFDVVDITNYILHATGQPLHCFDLNRIAGGKVIVKPAVEGEKFVTLDEVERTLTSNDLMICNEKESMCIAGVFGGLKSGVTNDTTDIFLESACFNPT